MRPCDCCYRTWRGVNAPGPCGCCYARQMPDGSVMQAKYRWVSRVSGNEIDLCEECCAVWRKNAEREPSLGASRITSLNREEPSE